MPFESNTLKCVQVDIIIKNIFANI